MGGGFIRNLLGKGGFVVEFYMLPGKEIHCSTRGCIRNLYLIFWLEQIPLGEGFIINLVL